MKRRYLLPLFVSVAFAAHAADPLPPVKEIMDEAVNGWSENPSDGKDYFDTERLDRIDSADFAKAYRAACTPDFFVFDHERHLAYRGQMDGSRPESEIPVTGEDLRQALDALLEKRPVSADQKPSIGCNIKWRAGNEPEYFK